MSQSDYVALAALAVSMLSALYARWAATETKRSNDISLHVHKVEIYEEVVSFSDCFRGLFNVPTAERLEKFRRNAVQRAEIYLSQDIYLQLKEIYEHCRDSQVWLSIAESKESGDAPSELEVRSEYKSVLNLLYPVIKNIKTEAMPNNA